MDFIYPNGIPLAMALVGYNSLLMGFFVLLKRRDLAGWSYLIFSLFVAVWGIGLSFNMNNEIPADSAYFWGRISQASALFIPLTWLCFVLAYTKQLRAEKKMMLFIGAITLSLSPFAFSKLFVPEFLPKVQLKYYTTAGPLYHVFTGVFVVAVIYAFYVIYREIKKESSGEIKREYKLLFAAQLYGFVMGSLSLLVVYDIPLLQYNLLIMPLWPFMLAFVMVRYQLFNLEDIIAASQRDKLAAIGTLAASMNHEIKNPLFIIRNLAEAHLVNMKEGIISDKDEIIVRSNEVMEKTIKHADRAISIMKTFLFFAKARDTRVFDLQILKINDVIGGVLPLLNHELDASKVSVKNNIPDGVHVRADRTSLEEIFFNLIANAVQCLKEQNGGEITLDARSGLSNQKYGVEVLVQDTGGGISPKDLKRVFEPFYTTKKTGNGLGLYITRKLAEKNNSQIYIKKSDQTGTVFSLSFPLPTGGGGVLV